MLPLIAFGPASETPSWNWVGVDTAQELQKYFRVAVYSPGQTPVADVIFVIKQIPSPRDLAAMKRSGARLVYVPIDCFRDEVHISSCCQFLIACDALVVHTESLAPYLHSYAPIYNIDHHGKFFLPALASYKESGYALWIGAMQNLPFFLQYLSRNPLGMEIKILCDVGNERAQNSATEVARRLGLQMRFAHDRANGFQLYPWSVDLQARMLNEARLAIDIKGDTFNQRNKPPTKAQQYICSGVPLAMNASEPVRYFARKGLHIPSPVDSRWLTRKYYEEVCVAAAALRPELTLEAIGRKYKQIVEDVLRSYG